MTCEHQDGWNITEAEPINEGGDEDIIVKAVCNHLNCEETKKFRLKMYDIEEV